MRSLESGQDDPLREKRQQQGTACAYRSGYSAMLKTLSLCIGLKRSRWHGQLIQGSKLWLIMCRVCTIATQPEFQTNASDQRAHTNHR